MIPRYNSEEMAKIFSDENKFQIWFDIEKQAAISMAKHGIVPQDAVDKIIAKGKIKFDVDKINKIEDVVKHDVIAFLTFVADEIGDEAKYLHLGMTSSDILDTGLNFQINQALHLIIQEVTNLMNVLEKRAYETKDLITMGRSHGIHAEPTTYGLKFAGFYSEFKRNKKRLQRALEEISVVKLSGSVGTFANIPPQIEQDVANYFGFTCEELSTQIVPRDRYAFLFSTLALTASAIERIGTEVRHLQRTEVAEVEENFTKGQKGSSSMPHKKNPILSENICGLARLVRSSLYPAFENINLWHERDISHSSVERGIVPDSFVHLHFALKRCITLVDNLQIYPKNIHKNLHLLGGLIHSQHILLELVKFGIKREVAYEIVQSSALECYKQLRDNVPPLDENGNELFYNILAENKELIKHINNKDLKSLFDVNRHLKNVDFILNRVFEK